MAAPKRVVWAPRAQRDLLEIWSYFARVGLDDVRLGCFARSIASANSSNDIRG
jgi:plasmid stabilization system protein ParE